MSTTDLLDEPTRFARGQKLYDLWQEAGGTLCMSTVDHKPFGRLHPYEQERWIYLAKMVGEAKHEHHLPPPADLLNHPGATQVTERIECWDWDEVTHQSLTPVSPKKLMEDLFYQLWKESRQARIRRHWWQVRRPRVLDTTRETFLQYLQDQKAYRGPLVKYYLHHS